ncbi:hypothetical protein CF165_26915 [Amycolatopsis vastitatis]|uniref:Uncharacterized protein n=1 Tax=Amycolatopsis vastitatis TaxID=1905142 RepID=A0A229SYR2_9PSEU|nr:hypothetical protein CF165_26915 [Amycolatopsis vastitatis]
MVDATAEIDEARPAISGELENLECARRQAEQAVADLKFFAAGGECATSRRELDALRESHDSDGAETRLLRPRWLPYLLWITLVANGLYDTMFFSTTWRQLADVSNEAWTVPWAISFLPGFTITAALLISGHQLAVMVARKRAIEERSKFRIRWRRKGLLSWRQVTETRDQKATPWPIWGIAISFTLLVLSTVGAWALIRAVQAETAGSVSINPVYFVLILLMFSITAIVAEIAHHNPAADNEKRVHGLMTKTEVRRDALITRAREALVGFTTVHKQLALLLESLQGRAHRHLDLAWAAILEERDGHGLAGDMAPEFSNQDEAEARFDGMREPQIRSALLTSAKQALEENAPTAIDKEMQQLFDELAGQTRSSLVEAATPTDPSPS